MIRGTRDPVQDAAHSRLRACVGTDPDREISIVSMGGTVVIESNRSRKMHHQRGDVSEWSGGGLA